MMDLIKRLKVSYGVYNFFHPGELKHNVPLFKHYGISKRYYSPLSSKDFKEVNPALVEPAEVSDFAGTSLFREMSEENRKSALAFDEKGFLILRGYLSPEKADQFNAEIAGLLSEKKIGFKYVNKVMFAIHQSSLLRSIGERKELKDFLGKLVGGEVSLFQSINFIMGSEQHTHSDSIHMTTFPLGGLLGAWIALDDITTENGPLHYYPGSHKLPYYLNADYDNEGSSMLIGKQTYSAYEAMIEGKIKEWGLKKEVFTAKKGDLLVWHANLFHGGEPHRDKRLTRRSMVLHYFRQNSICYHEITQRPALIKTIPL